MNTRRQFLIAAPLGVVGAAVACRGASNGASDRAAAGPAPAPSSGAPVPAATPGAPPTFATAPAFGPEVTVSTFVEAEKLAQVSMTPGERDMAAKSWRRSMAPLLERRSG